MKTTLVFMLQEENFKTALGWIEGQTQFQFKIDKETKTITYVVREKGNADKLQKYFREEWELLGYVKR